MPGCQSSFYDANRVKNGFTLFELPKEPVLLQKQLQVIKRYWGADRFSKIKKLWFVNFLLTQSQFGYLWRKIKKCIYQEVHNWCLNLSLLRRKKLTPPKSLNNQGTSIEFEIESLSSDFQRLGDALNSVDDFAKEIGNTSKILAKNESLRWKVEHLEFFYKNLKEKNVRLKSHVYNFGNVSDSGKESRAATGHTGEYFNNLRKFLNRGEGSCNIIFTILQADSLKIVMTMEVQSLGQSQNYHLPISSSYMWLG